MSGVINLSKVRKRAKELTKRTQAAANATKHGLTKTEKAARKAQADKARARLDGHQRE